MSGRLSNIDNSHPFYGSSNQGMVTGCTGGAIGQDGNCQGIVQARGIVGAQKGGSNAPNANGDFPTAAAQAEAARRGMKSFLDGASGGQIVQNGGGYGFTTEGAVQRQNAAPAVSETSNCNRLSPAFKMGAGQIYQGAAALQKGGGTLNPLAPTASDYFNQSTHVGYGYESGADNLLFAGSGYPKETPTTSIQTCQSGGRKSRRRKSRRRTHIKKRQRGGFLCHMKRRTHPKKGQPSRTRKGRLDFITHLGDKVFNARGRRQRRSRKPYTKRKGKRRGQRGGASRYLQYQSNEPLTHTMQTPNGTQGGSWAGQLATPPTYKVLNNCQDDYIH